VDQNSFSITLISGANNHSLFKMLVPIVVGRQKFFIILSSVQFLLVYYYFSYFNEMLFKILLKNQIITCDIIS